MNQMMMEYVTWTTYVIGAVVYGLPVTLLSMRVYIRSERDPEFAESVRCKVLKALLWPLSVLVIQDDETTPALADWVDPYDGSSGEWMVYVIFGIALWPVRAFLWLLAMAMFVALRIFYHCITQPILLVGRLLPRGE